ncbi:MAG: molybdopterin molybdotransferase MoeA, partial [Candidatus Heimdallarchaeaceae archaeon]
MRPFKSLISIDEAHEILWKNIHPITETEEVELLNLVGRVSSEDVKALMNVPPFRRSAMDGYAVKAESTFDATVDSPIYLDCIEKILAGEVPQKVIESGQCSEIATGAMLPEGADCVVPVEYTNLVDGKIEIFKNHPPNANVSAEGVDVKKGEIVVHKGEVYTPARVGVLAALNIQKAKVYKKPVIAIIPTGKEISPLGVELKKGQVYDINSYTLTTLVRKFGAEPKLYDIVADEFEALEKAVLDALSNDLVVVLGGSSVGERDINVDVLTKHGKILLHGIQIKPGKPTLCGIIKDTPIINLPGYPTSCLTIGYIILLPLLRKLAHLKEIKKEKVKAKISRKIASSLGR